MKQSVPIFMKPYNPDCPAPLYCVSTVPHWTPVSTKRKLSRAQLPLRTWCHPRRPPSKGHGRTRTRATGAHVPEPRLFSRCPRDVSNLPFLFGWGGCQERRATGAPLCPPGDCPTARALAGWPPRVATERMETRLCISQPPPLCPAPPVCFPATPPRHPPRAGETLASHVSLTLRPPSLPDAHPRSATPLSPPTPRAWHPHPARGRATPPAKCVLPRPPREADPSPVALQVQSTGAPPPRVSEGGDGDTKTRLPESFPRHQPPPMRGRCPRHGGGPRTPCPAGRRRHQELRICTCGIFANTGVGVPHPSCAPPWSRRKV